MAMNSSFPTDRPGSNTASVLGAVGGSSVERGQLVFSSGLAAGVLKMDDQVEEILETDEDDDYYKMLTLFGRWPYGHVVIALSVVLKIRRTLTGAEIDDVITTVLAGFELALEQRRRADWRNRELSAISFPVSALFR